MENDPRKLIWNVALELTDQTSDIANLAVIWKNCVDDLLNSGDNQNDPNTLRYIEAAQFRYRLYAKPA